VHCVHETLLNDKLVVHNLQGVVGVWVRGVGVVGQGGADRTTHVKRWWRRFLGSGCKEEDAADAKNPPVSINSSAEMHPAQARSFQHQPRSSNNSPWPVEPGSWWRMMPPPACPILNPPIPNHQ
jgi:hypothetical protein